MLPMTNLKSRERVPGENRPSHLMLQQGLITTENLEAVARILLQQDGLHGLYANLSPTADPWDIMSDDFKTAMRARAYEILDSLSSSDVTA
jgi:hypothetical protein